MLNEVKFQLVYKHDEYTWRGKTTTHKITDYKLKEDRSGFLSNPHNYRRMYCISSYCGVVRVSVVNLCDVYIKPKIASDPVLYTGFENELDKRSFTNLNEALKFLEETYYVKVKGIFDLENILNDLKEYFPLLTIEYDNRKIILNGDTIDFENFMIELDEALPEEYTFENHLKGQDYNTCEIIVSEKE